MATTYAELQAEGLAWLRNDAAESQVTNFISLAEDEMNSKTRGVRRAITATATVDAASATLPDDFQEVRSFRLTDGSRALPLQPITAEQYAKLKAATTETGEPEAFCVLGGAFQFFPEPDATYAAELIYTGRVVKLSASNTSNWVLEEFPSVYLNGLLWRGYMFLKNVDMATAYGQLFLGGLADIRAANRTVYAPMLRSDVPAMRATFDIVRG